MNNFNLKRGFKIMSTNFPPLPTFSSYIRQGGKERRMKERKKEDFTMFSSWLMNQQKILKELNTSQNPQRTKHNNHYINP